MPRHGGGHIRFVCRDCREAGRTPEPGRPIPFFSVLYFGSIVPTKQHINRINAWLHVESRWDRVIEQLLLVSSHRALNRSCCCTWRTIGRCREERTLHPSPSFLCVFFFLVFFYSWRIFSHTVKNIARRLILTAQKTNDCVIGSRTQTHTTGLRKNAIDATQRPALHGIRMAFAIAHCVPRCCTYPHPHTPLQPHTPTNPHLTQHTHRS